jgi:Baseplate J-like protein
MHSNTLEEAELTDNTSEQEQQPDQPETNTSPEPEEAQPETQEQEITALVPTESDIIEGEFVEIDPPEASENHIPPKQKPYWLLIPFTILLCLEFIAASILFPLLTPSATVTIIPVERTITLTAAIQVQGRQLLPLTLMQSLSAPATGKRHQDAARAHGTITFYNGLLSSQTIPAGTIFTGKDGVQIITDQAAHIPAGNPPSYGQVTVSARAVLTGQQGNIPAYDINVACCATSVVAKNTESFTGGAAAREYLEVSREDINTAVTSLLLVLSRSDNAALQAQLHPGEALAVSSCTPHVASDHKPGDVANQVTVTVSETCGGIAYAAHEVYIDAMQLLTAQAATTLGVEYALLGDIQITIVHATAGDHHQGSVTMLVQVTSTWVYQITPGMQHHLLRLIAGKTNQQAAALLVQFPGIAGAQISLKGGNRTLPQDPRHIHLTIVYQSVSL